MKNLIALVFFVCAIVLWVSVYKQHKELEAIDARSEEVDEYCKAMLIEIINVDGVSVLHYKPLQ